MLMEEFPDSSQQTPFSSTFYEQKIPEKCPKMVKPTKLTETHHVQDGKDRSDHHPSGFGHDPQCGLFDEHTTSNHSDRERTSYGIE